MEYFLAVVFTSLAAICGWLFIRRFSSSKKVQDSGSKEKIVNQTFPKLSSSPSKIEPFYDVIVVGSGYGASIAASRCARAGQKVCVLERGKEWVPGEFPESPATAAKQFQVTCNGKENTIGKPTNLYDVIISDDITVVKGCGLGGTSLINANVCLDADPRVFEDKLWPQEIRNDMDKMMEYDRKHFEDMMRPTRYPDEFPKLKKLDAMQNAAEGLHDIEEVYRRATKVPLFVNFEDKKTAKTQHRFNQPACNGCGNCCSGCNTGAKQTLNMNYLPDAKCYGAQIFTTVSVTAVQKDPYGPLWVVHYKRQQKHSYFEKELMVRAKNVIIGAGSIGSTKILLQSKERGLAISPTIGSRFSGNGDALGFSFHGENKVNSIGLKTGKFPKVNEESPGPCITSVIDLRELPNMPLKKGMVLEDGTPPGASELGLKIAMAFFSKTLGKKKFPSTDKWKKFAEKLNDEQLDKTLAFLCMSHDDSSGKISLHPKSKGPIIEWKDVGSQEIFKTISSRMEEFATELKGTYVINPIWSSLMNKGIVTVHPLGGCPMGKHGGDGVVNHKGQVFIGDSDDVYRGLYVMDGSIIPTSVGVNPVATISMLAERSCRLLAEDAQWEIDFDSRRNFYDLDIKRPEPGLKFSERMAGKLKFKETNESSDCEFNVTIETDDVAEMLERDPEHTASISGTVECSFLSKNAMTISNGLFNLFERSEEILDAKEMKYYFELSTSEHEKYYFKGRKIIKKKNIGEIGLKDTTTLFVDLLNDEEELIANGVLNIYAPDFAKQLQTIEITNTQSFIQKIKWGTKFMNFFAGTLWHTYVSRKDSRYSHEDAPSRKKRELNLNGAAITDHEVVTEDNVSLRLTRFKGGCRGPLLAFHGLGVSSKIFSLDTIPTNFVEYFVRNEFDVWLFDSRMSVECPWASTTKLYTMDDVIFFDVPAAVRKVIEITNAAKIQVLAHCAGAMTFWGSLISGALEGMIEAVVISQVVPISRGKTMNRIKAKLFSGKILEMLGNDNISVDASIVPGFLANLFLEHDEHCRNMVCHQITSLYGLLYEHSNLNVKTHDQLIEFFGKASVKFIDHLSRCFRGSKLLDRNGHDVYLPGLDSHGNFDQNSADLEWTKNVDVPIYVFCGDENKVYQPESVKIMHDVLTKLYPQQKYEMEIIPGYGHIDGLIGKHAYLDVWPRILAFLEKHSNIKCDDIHCDAVINEIERMRKNHQLKCDGGACFESDTDVTDRGIPLEGERSLTSLHSEIEEDAGIDEPDILDGPKSEAKSIWEKIKKLLPGCKSIDWPTLRDVTHIFNKKPEYTAKNDDHIEEVTITDEQKDRRIIVLSDTHFGSAWTGEMIEKLHTFIELLAECAKEEVHTLVLLGDIFDLWNTEIDKEPRSKEEKMQRWQQNERFAHFISKVKKMADCDEVNAYYIRGNHDFEMTAGMVKELFGEKMKFIESGKLVLCVNTDHGQKYRIRFEHGHHHDLFNCLDYPINGRPIGYYISRCQQSLEKWEDTPTTLQNVISALIKHLGFASWIIMQALSRTFVQERLVKHIFEVAYGKKETLHDASILLENGEKVSIEDLCKHPFINDAVNKHGTTGAYQMLQASMGIYEDILARMNEEVIVLGHTHVFKNDAFHGKSGSTIYANSGTWVDTGDEFSYVDITTPTKFIEGCVQVQHAWHFSKPQVPKPKYML